MLLVVWTAGLSGFLPAFLKINKFIQQSNQKGAPSEITKALFSQPKSYTMKITGTATKFIFEFLFQCYYFSISAICMFNFDTRANLVLATYSNCQYRALIIILLYR